MISVHISPRNLAPFSRVLYHYFSLVLKHRKRCIFELLFFSLKLCKFGLDLNSKEKKLSVALLYFLIASVLFTHLFLLICSHFLIPVHKLISCYFHSFKKCLVQQQMLHSVLWYSVTKMMMRSGVGCKLTATD